MRDNDYYSRLHAEFRDQVANLDQLVVVSAVLGHVVASAAEGGEDFARRLETAERLLEAWARRSFAMKSMGTR